MKKYSKLFSGRNPDLEANHVRNELAQLGDTTVRLTEVQEAVT